MSSTLDSVPQSKSATGDVGKLKLGKQEIDLPIVVGTRAASTAVDISQAAGPDRLHHARRGLRQHRRTAPARSRISTASKGVLRYRGYPIEVIAEKCDFVEVSYLLIYGELPTDEQLEQFRNSLRRHTMLHEDMRSFYNGFPRDAHPMAILSSVVGALSTFYQDSLDPHDARQVEISVHRLMAKLPTIAAMQLQEVDRPAVHLSAERPDVSAKTSCR